MKNFLILIVAALSLEAFGTCSSPISRVNNGANLVLTSTKYNADHNTAYTKINDLDGDCISDTSIPTAKYEAASVTKAKLAVDAKDHTVLAKTANYTVLVSDDFVTGDATSGAVTFTLPTAVGISGRSLTFKKIDSSVNKVILDANSSQTIDGSLTYEMLFQYQTARIVSNGANWVLSTAANPKLKTCVDAAGGASATLASPTECTTGTCIEVYDSCVAATPPTHAGTGDFTGTTFANGTFANNSYITCTCNAWDTTNGTVRTCFTYFATGSTTWSASASGGMIVNAQTTTVVGGVVDSYLQISCTGTAP